MIRKALLILLLTSSLLTSSLFSQEVNPLNSDRFADISRTETDFNTGHVAARMVAGLGFRYYWATEGLTKEDLIYRTSDTGRTSFETVKHIHGLSEFMLAFLGENPASVGDQNDFEKVRLATLLNLEMVERKLKDIPEADFKEYSAGQVTFWQFINGPVADALWHAGQVVMMRRASGNPIAEGVNVLMGTKG